MTAVADPSERVRRTVLQALASSSSLDDHLAQADCLRALFVALNDESFNIRGITISLVGRLAQRNPAYVNPALRRHLLQLLTDMECSPDSRWAAGSRGSGCVCWRCQPRCLYPPYLAAYHDMVSQVLHDVIRHCLSRRPLYYTLLLPYHSVTPSSTLPPPPQAPRGVCLAAGLPHHQRPPPHPAVRVAHTEGAGQQAEGQQRSHGGRSHPSTAWPQHHGIVHRQA
jgi:hypothetical protein